MAQSFNNKLIELLNTDTRFVDDEGELVKHAVIDSACSATIVPYVDVN